MEKRHTMNLLLIFASICSICSAFTLTTKGEATLLCPSNVPSFSTGAFKQIYYKCEKEGEPAVLHRCPENQVYCAVKEKCSSEGIIKNSVTNSNRDIKPITKPILGNEVLLGCLYNAKSNEIMAADSFWKRKTVEENTVVTHSHSQKIQFFAAQSTFDRLNHMDLDVALQVDFLGGLIHVEGSAAFLQDTVDTENTFAVIMNAHYATHSKLLPTSIPIEFENLCQLQGPTHVVTSIDYGMDANFVFKKSVGKHQSRQEISGNLKIAVKSFPSIKIDGSGSAHINETLKKLIENIEVKLFGDFVLDEQPTTYEESLKVFKTLPKQLGEKPDYAQAAKMKMHLTPIKRFCDKTTTILISISKNVLHRVTEMLDKIERTKLKANTLLMSDSVNKYIQLKTIIETFINKLSVFELEKKSALQKILPSIRSGSESGENKLVKLLTNYTKSPFNYPTSRKFLEIRSREIEMIDFILDPESFKGTEVTPLDFEKASDDKIMFTKPNVIMLKYNILPSMTIVNKYLDNKPVDETNSWFNDQKIIASMGEEFKAYMNFANANRNTKDHGFLIGLHPTNKTHTNVYAQRNGEILSASFDIPKAPPKMIMISNKYNAISFCIARPSNKWVNSFIITYNHIFEDIMAKKQFDFDDVSPKTAVITDLQPNRIYQFNLTYVTVMGNSPSSPRSDPIVTRPCSPPTNLHQSSVTSSGFDITWSPPLYIGKGVNISGYEVTVRVSGKDFVKEVVSSNLHLSVKGVAPASLYTVMITAIVNPPKYNESTKLQGTSSSSLPAIVKVISLPSPPSTLNLVEVSFHSAEINWYQPKEIADGASIKDYLVKYVVLDNTGSESYKGTEMTRSSNNKTSITLTDLVEGTTYGITVKVLTSLGDSRYSPTLIIKTKFKETELDKLRHSVKTELTSVMDKKIDDLRKKEETVMDKKIDDLRKKEETVDKKVSTIYRRFGTVDSTLRELKKKFICNTDKVIYFPQGTLQHAMKECYTFQNGEASYYLRFVGYGSVGSEDSQLYYDVSFPECIEKCHGKRMEDNRWNGMMYGWSAIGCFCYKNMKGLNPRGKDNYVLYAFRAY